MCVCVCVCVYVCVCVCVCVYVCGVKSLHPLWTGSGTADSMYGKFSVDQLGDAYHVDVAVLTLDDSRSMHCACVCVCVRAIWLQGNFSALDAENFRAFSQQWSTFRFYSSANEPDAEIGTFIYCALSRDQQRVY